MREKQRDRIEKSEQVTVEDLWEVQEGVFAANMVNDRGEDREKIMLVPFRVTSETSDSIHRSEYVGKYLLACAREDSEFRELLRTGLQFRINKLSEKYRLSVERGQLSEALKATDDRKTVEALYDRIAEIGHEIGSKSPSEIEDEIKNQRTALRYVNRLHLEGNSEEQDVSDEEIEEVITEEPVVVFEG